MTAPTEVTQPIRDEHGGLIPHIEFLRQVANNVGEVPQDQLRREVDEACEFLTRHLIPHAKAEEEVLYPAAATAMGAPEATQTMIRDHVEVVRLTEELESLRSQLAGRHMGVTLAKALRRVLYGLYVLVKVHFHKEEEVYLPLLEQRLTEDEARLVFEAMERAEGEARR